MKTCTMEDILEKVRPGDTLAFGYVHSGLKSVFDVLASSSLPENLEIFVLFLRFRRKDLLALNNTTERFEAHFVTPLPIPEISSLVKEKKIDVLCLPYSKITSFLASKNKTGRVWLFCETTSPVGDLLNTGYTSLFPLKLHRKCINVSLINPALPTTLGDSQLPAGLFTYAVEIPNGTLPLYMKTEVSEASRKIAEHVSELIDDDSTIQLGIGSAISPVVEYLKGKEDLKVHTGLFNQNLSELVKEGVIEGKCHAHLAIPFTSDFYNWLNLNPCIEMRSIDYIYSASIMASIRKFVAVNTAVYVDLQGEAVATSISSRIISGIGGLLDFSRGAKSSRNGKSIIALESTYREGTSSRIRPIAMPGDSISLTSYDIDYVVTEYGIAQISGKSRKQSALELIGVAAPDHRDMLYQEAKKLNIL